MDRPRCPDKKTRLPEAERPKVIVSGSRTFTDYALLKDKLDFYLGRLTDPIIMHGGAKGADRLAGRWAEWYWYGQWIYHADWDLYGKSAGPKRNEQMVEAALATNCGRFKKPALIAFHKGNSPGTKHCIAYAKKRGLVVKVVEV